MISEDADVEKIGRILNRVIKCGRDGITMEADQRQVREVLKDLEKEKANHAATPCNMDTKNEKNARSDGSKGENQCEQGQRQTKHDWDDAGDGDDKNKVQMRKGHFRHASAANPSASDLERVKRIGRYLVGKPRGKFLLFWQQSGELEACTRRSVSAGVIMRGGHCFKSMDQEAAGGILVHR